MEHFSIEITKHLSSLILKKCGIESSQIQNLDSKIETTYEKIFPTLSDITSIKATDSKTSESYNSPFKIIENENKIKLIERQLLHALNEIQSRKTPVMSTDDCKKQIMKIYDDEISNMSTEEMDKNGGISCFQSYKVEVLMHGAFRDQRLQQTLKEYVENKFNIQKVQAKDLKFYQNTNLDFVSSMFTSVLKQLERLRKLYATKLGTNLIVYSYYPVNLLKSKTLSFGKVIDSLYTTTSRRGDGGEGLYGDLVETIRFKMDVFYDLADKISESVKKIDENVLDAKLDELIGENAQNLTSEKIQNFIKPNSLVRNYDKEVWDNLLKFASESESVAKFMKAYAKDRYYRSKLKENVEDTEKYLEKLKRIHDELGFFDSLNIDLLTGTVTKHDFMLKDEFFDAQITDETMKKIIITCLNGCYRELIEETTESTGKKTEASIAYERYIKNFSQNIVNNVPHRIVAAGFAKDKNNQWVYTREYKVPFEIGRTGFPFGFRNFPALVHPAMLTSVAIIDERVTNDYLEMIRAYDRSWTRATVGAIIGVFDLLLKNTTDQDRNFNVINSKLTEFYNIQIRPQEMNGICLGHVSATKLCDAVLQYKINQRKTEDLFEKVWPETERCKPQFTNDTYVDSEILRSKARKENSTLKERQNLTEEITKRLKPQSKIGIGANGNIAEQGDLTPRSFTDIISLYGVQNINYVDKDGKPTKIPQNVDVLDLNRTTSDIASLRHKNLTMTYASNFYGGLISGLASAINVLKQQKDFKKDDFRDFIKLAISKSQEKVFQKNGAHLVSLVAIAAEFEQYNEEEMNYGRLCEYVANQLNNALLITDVHSNEARLTPEDVSDIDTFIVGKYIDCLENYNLVNKGQIERVKYSNCGLCKVTPQVLVHVSEAKKSLNSFYERYN